MLSTHLSWGPVAKLYSRYLYALIYSVMSLNCWVAQTEGATNELLFWQGLPRLRYFSQEESVESSTFRELLGVLRCLKSTVL